MKTVTFLVCAVLVVGGFGAGVWYARSDAGVEVPVEAQATQSPSSAGVAARVGQEVISQLDLDKALGYRLLTLQTEEYEIRRSVLDDLVRDRLLKAEADRRGVSVDALVKTEIDAKAPTPSPADVNAILEANRSRLGTMTEDQARKSITDTLTERGKSARRDAFVKELSAKTNVRILLEPPRLSAAYDPTAPVRGPKDAPVTIVEFSDFQCPYCGRSNGTMQQLMKQYPTQVRWVFRDFPLSIHKDAEPAAVAARCAKAQGKFWEMHDLLFQNQRDLSKEALTRYGAQIGLDVGAYASCRASEATMAAMKKDMAAGEAFGITGTPAFYINGRFLNGARPIESFTEIIEEELQFKQALR